MVMLDTNTCIWIMNRDPRLAPENFQGECLISQVVLGELEYGVFNSDEKYRLQNRAALDDFLSKVIIAPISNKVTREYGRIRARLKQEGTMIGPNDLWIAAQAVYLGLPLVTANTREFSRVEDLVLDNWANVNPKQ